MAHRAPLYSLGGTGPQCSGSTDFCFFCEFDNGGNLETSGQNLYENLKDIVRSMAENKKEIDSIIRAVAQNYEQYVRQHVEYCHPVTNVTISQPEWTTESIKRHLLYSTEFSGLFQAALEQVFHSLFTVQSASLVEVDQESGKSEIDSMRLKEFNDTVKTYLAFMKHQQSKS